MLKKLNETKKEQKETKRSERKHKELFHILSEAKKIYIFFLKEMSRRTYETDFTKKKHKKW